MAEQLPHYDVIVIGGGAAGLMCAMTAGQRGRRVLVIEHANRIGKKILLSGGGRCNFTNINAGPANYLSSNPHFVKSALARYRPADFIALVERHGIRYHEKKLGQLFCDDSAKQIVQMLADECRGAGVQIITRCDTDSVQALEPGFALETTRGRLACDSLVIASGGLSFPTMGASDFGYRIAQQFGLPVLPARAALVPFVFEDEMLGFCAGLAGIAMDCVARIGKAAFRENLLFTHRGLSGPAVLQISSYWQEGGTVSFDLLPELDAPAWLREAKRTRARARVRTVLAERLPDRFVDAIEGQWFENRVMAECRDAALEALGRKLNGWEVVPAGTEGYRTAEVTIGGIDTRAVSSQTMEARNVPGLYFIGEVLDVTGWLGGYNFQWAWASGFAAGQAV